MKPSVPQPSPPKPGARLLKASASFTQPDVWLLDPTGEPRVWKTFRETPWLARHTVGRYLARREARNLRALHGIPRVPRLLAMPEPWTIEMSYLDALPVPDQKLDHGLAPGFFEQLEAMLAEIHRRGLNHGDVRRMNVLRLRATGEPCLIDFAQSMKARSPHSLFVRIILRHAYHIDRLKFLKIKKWYLGYEVLSETERAEYARKPRHLKLGRWLRNRIYRRAKHHMQGRHRKGKLRR